MQRMLQYHLHKQTFIRENFYWKVHLMAQFLLHMQPNSFQKIFIQKIKYLFVPGICFPLYKLNILLASSCVLNYRNPYFAGSPVTLSFIIFRLAKSPKKPKEVASELIQASSIHVYKSPIQSVFESTELPTFYIYFNHTLIKPIIKVLSIKILQIKDSLNIIVSQLKMEFVNEVFEVMKLENSKLKIDLENAKSLIDCLTKINNPSVEKSEEINTQLYKLQIINIRARYQQSIKHHTEEKKKLQQENIENLAGVQNRMQLTVDELNRIKKQNEELKEYIKSLKLSQKEQNERHIINYQGLERKSERSEEQQKKHFLNKIKEIEERNERQQFIMREKISKLEHNYDLILRKLQMTDKCLTSLKQFNSIENVRNEDERKYYQQIVTKLKQQLEQMQKKCAENQFKFMNTVTENISKTQLIRQLQKDIKQLRRQIIETNRKNRKAFNKEKMISQNALESLSAQTKYYQKQSASLKKKQKQYGESQKQLTKKLKEIQSQSFFKDLPSNSNKTQPQTVKSSLNNSQIDPNSNILTPNISRFICDDEQHHNQMHKYQSLKLQEIVSELTIQNLDTPCFDSQKNLQNELKIKLKSKRFS